MKVLSTSETWLRNVLGVEQLLHSQKGLICGISFLRGKNGHTSKVVEISLSSI